MPIITRHLSHKALLFYNNNTSSSICTIDAHGEQTLTHRAFIVPPGKVVRFYVEHGAALATNALTVGAGQANSYKVATSLMAIANNTATSVQTLTEGMVCPNYRLSRIHKSTTGFFGGRVANYLGDRHDYTYEDIKKFIQENSACSSIVSIKSGGIFTSNPTLQEVIAELPENYTEIRCDFCRSPQIPFFQHSAPNSFVIGALKAPGPGEYTKEDRFLDA